MAAMNSPMKQVAHESNRKEVNKGAWTAEEDKKLDEIVAVHGPKRWNTIAVKAGLNRCGKSCRLRWMNYLRPNIKRGDMSDQEEDLILRLHKLLGNRWSLIAGRLPGRTDNEIKNYWNSRLSKKLKQQAEKDKELGTEGQELITGAKRRRGFEENMKEQEKTFNDIDMTKNGDICNNNNNGEDSGSCSFDVDDFFDFSSEDFFNLEWISRFLQPGGEV